MPRQIGVAAVAAFLALVANTNCAVAHRNAIDDGLYTTYSTFPNDLTQMSVLVCGTVKKGFGCFGGARLQPFQSICATMEGAPTTNGNVVTRAIYVLDRHTDGNPVELYVYSMTEKIGNRDATFKVKLMKKVSLGIKGGSGAQCSMAGNSPFLYAGSDQDVYAAIIDKSSFTVTLLGSGAPPEPVRDITSDDRGYVCIHFDSIFYAYDPNGAPIEDGGGNTDIGNPHNAFRVN